MSEQVTKSLTVIVCTDSETGLLTHAVSLDDMNKVIEYLNQQADRINKENARLKAEVERLQRRCDELFMENHRFVERVWLNGYLSGKDDKEVQS